MKVLSEHELWERVKGLQGRTVYTIERLSANKVLKVTDNEVRLAKENGELRSTTPIKSDIVNTYDYLMRHGQVTREDYSKIPESRYWAFVGRVVYAILRDAVPEQIEEFHRRPPHVRLSGIRLKV